MAERFYSLHGDENSYYNSNVPNQQNQQQQQQPAAQQLQQQQQTLAGTNMLQNMATTNVLVSDFNNNNSNNNNINQINNNNNTNAPRNATMRYFGAPVGNFPAGVGAAGNGYDKMCSCNNNNNNNNMTGSMNFAGNYVAGMPGCEQHTSIMSTTNMSCQYAHANGSASCYNRNRYMPYNHNRMCAAAAVAAATGQPLIVQQHGHPGSAISLPSTTSNLGLFQQSFAPIYQQAGNALTPLPASVHHQQPSTIVSCGAVAGNNAGIHSDFASYSNISNTPSACNSSSTLPSNSSGAAVVVGGASTAAAGLNMSFTSLDGAVISGKPGLSYGGGMGALASDPTDAVTLQITNLDYSLDESSLRNFLLNQLKPITPVVSLVFEGSSYAKVTVPDLYFAKQVVSNLHRKKIGHKRMLVSYTRDSSLTEINTLRCQVAGLLKDVPYYTLPMYKFRELFQSRFKTSISVLDLYKMQDICTINSDNNEDKFISLQPELVNSLESSPLMEGLQHSVPYCTAHFKREQHKGWAEQDIEPLPNVCMTIAEIQKIVYPLLKHHPGDIPVATLVHCIEGELKVQITTNESGVNLEHLVCCVQGIQIQVNNFGIKILELAKESTNAVGTGSAGTAIGGGSGLGTNGNGSSFSGGDRNGYAKNAATDPLYQISREVIELVKTSPKSTMKFNRFIPAYHNHFGKQCRVADYGYTKLIELFEALANVVQIMGDGENRQITLTHRTQIRRFTSDLLRVLRAHGNNSVLLSQLPSIFTQTQNRNFDVTDYGVCDIVDILDGLVNSNIVVVSTVQNGKDVLISIPKRKQTNNELEKTCIFAGEMVELFRNALQYTILFQKFVRSYHYHFAYQCRLSDYGFLKLADLMEAIHGVVELELTSDEDKKIYLSPVVARRVFAEQCDELIRNVTGSSMTSMKLDQVLKMHKKKYGYQILPQTLGAKDIVAAIEALPYVELSEKEESTWITCHNNDAVFRTQCYRACKHILQSKTTSTPASTSKHRSTADESAAKQSTAVAPLTMTQFIADYNANHKNHLTEAGLKAMKHAIEIYKEGDKLSLRITRFMKFIMTIVRLLEQRTTLLLHELKSALDCGVTTTFEFGYPNLYSILAAYPDLFALNVGATHERSDVTLTPNCELRHTTAAAGPQHLFGALKLNYGKQKAQQRNGRAPLAEHNSSSRLSAQPPPHKARMLTNDYAITSGGGAAVTAFKNQMQAHGISMGMQQGPFSVTAQPNYPKPQASVGSKHSPPFGGSTASTLAAKHCSSTINSSSIYSTASMHSSMLNNTSGSNLSLCSNSNKENSLNGSLQFVNSSFNTSTSNNASFELNNSLVGHITQQSQSGIGSQPPYSNKLWDRRQSLFMQQQSHPQQQQHQQQSLLGNTLPSLLSLQAPSANSTVVAESSGLYELVSNMPMCPIYEPPKPDTPPSDTMPFWIDPIWTNNSSHGTASATHKSNLLNIRLPELKSLNVLPMLLSPYTLSKTENMKQQVFNFDNHDRKIA